MAPGFDEGGLAWDDTNNNRAFLGGDIAATLNGAAKEERRRARAVIRSARAVRRGRAAELRRNENSRVTPHGPELLLQRSKPRIERTEPLPPEVSGQDNLDLPRLAAGPSGQAALANHSWSYTTPSGAIDGWVLSEAFQPGSSAGDMKST